MVTVHLAAVFKQRYIDENTLLDVSGFLIVITGRGVLHSFFYLPGMFNSIFRGIPNTPDKLPISRIPSIVTRMQRDTKSSSAKKSKWYGLLEIEHTPSACCSGLPK